MKNRRTLRTCMLLAAAFLCLSLSPSALEARAGGDKKGWKILGTKKVGEGLDRDEIRVYGKKGTFRQLKVNVKNAPIELERLIVHFDKDEKQVVWLRKNFDEGSWSRVIQVKGGKREIRKVVFWYTQADSGGEEPVVALWGRQ